MRIFEYTIEQLARGRLRREDRCSLMRLTYDCPDMEMKVSEILREVGLW